MNLLQIALSEAEKAQALDMVIFERVKIQMLTNPGIGADKYMSKYYSGDHRSGMVQFKHAQTMPQKSHTPFVSVASKTSYSYLLLEWMMMKHEEPSEEVSCEISRNSAGQPALQCNTV